MHLRNEEWFNFHLEGKALMIRFNPEWLKIAAIFALYLPLLTKADELLEVIRKSSLTKEIKELDGKRDKAFRALKAGLKFGLTSLDPEKHKAAERLDIVFHHFGDLAKKSYNEETGGIINLIEELRGKFASDVELLDLGERVNDLESTNDNFEAVIALRNEETADRPEAKLVEVRQEVDHCYLQIIDLIEALVLVDGVERYSEFIRNLNANTERYKRVHHHRN